MPTHFATPGIRLAIIASISALVYWPVFFFLMESVRDRKQILQFVTLKRLFLALGLGAAASLIAHKLNILAPTVFGLLNVPSDYVLLPFTILFIPLGGTHFTRWLDPVRLVGGCFAYGMIAFFVLYKTIWNKSTSSQAKSDIPHPG
jgi:hypothetical protein